MSNLNNLISKIKEEGNAQVKAIKAEGDAKRDAIISKYTKEGEEVKSSLVEKAKREGATRKERILSNAALKVRNEKLKVKGELIDKVFIEATKSLKHLNGEHYKNFIVSSLRDVKLEGGEEILFSEAIIDGDSLLKEVNSTLNTSFKLSDEKVSSGFMVRNNGIDMNFSFENIVSFQRDTLEGEIVSLLF
ncbi:V-type ATP synthase subunit E [Clostridium bornimense]|uniref:V-type ATP synthase subunit E n=1 Tax=Clostridium bornimense TaxID=1216932 RepID=W6RXK5_9CLOT|nr:V-type ATP synthase subunit E family protein [Clostridium bornimense]CDM68364.1 V-type ATP synthase subunit E [Clostridium bornimense]